MFSCDEWQILEIHKDFQLHEFTVLLSAIELIMTKL